MTAQAWATIAVGAIAGLIAVVTIGQKRLADNRKEWWTRCQWALEATYSDNPDHQQDGWALVDDLIESPLVTTTERRVAIRLAFARYRWDTRDTDRSGDFR